MVNTLARLGARAYWRANMPFVAAFAESLLGYGEGAYAVDGKAIAARLDGFLAEVNTPVFLQFVATLALLPLYEPPKWPRSNLAHSVVKVWYFFKSLFAHGQFLAASKEKQVLSSIEIGSPISATTTAANGVLYIATMTRLYTVERSK